MDNVRKSVYGYVRVSTDTQSQKGYGIDTQRQAIEKYCEENDLHLLKVFEDRGISGTEAVEADGDELISKRKGLLELLSQLDGTNTIVVLNTSRLWRSDIAKVLIRREKGVKKLLDIVTPRPMTAELATDALMSGYHNQLKATQKMLPPLPLLELRHLKRFFCI